MPQKVDNPYSIPFIIWTFVFDQYVDWYDSKIGF